MNVRRPPFCSLRFLPRSFANSPNHNLFLFSRFRTLLKIVFPASLSKSVPCALFRKTRGGRGVQHSFRYLFTSFHYFSRPTCGDSIFKPSNAQGYHRCSTCNFHPLNLFRTLSRLPRASRGRNGDWRISFLFVTSLLHYFITSLPGRRCSTRHSLLTTRCSTSERSCRRAKILKLTAVELR
jgi:hypothetical protein